MYEDKFLQFLLKNLLIYGSKTIKDIAQSKKTTNEIKLVKMLLDLLQEKYSENAFEIFKTEIIKKNLAAKPGSKNIVKQIYFLIVADKMSRKELDEKEKDIELMINNLKSTSKFFSIKKHLIVKVRQLKDIKAHYLEVGLNDVSAIPSELELLMKKLSAEKTLNFELLKLILDSWNKDIVSRHKADFGFNAVINARFRDFFNGVVISKCKVMLGDRADANEKISEDINAIIYKMNILASLLEFGKNQSTVNKCLDWFRKLRYKYKSDEGKFKKREQDRLDDAYSSESLEKTLSLHASALHNANEMLRTYGDGKYPLIDENILEKYSSMVKNKDPRLLDKKFYDKILGDTRKTTEKAISNVKISKEFSTQGKILKAIMTVFK